MKRLFSQKLMKKLAGTLGAFALFASFGSYPTSFILILREPKMPESMIVRD